jgi:hypothetical protein
MNQPWLIVKDCIGNSNDFINKHNIHILLPMRAPLWGDIDRYNYEEKYIYTVLPAGD